MIVEPVPLGPPSARRRRLRALALVVPLVLLGGVVAAGTLGPQAAPSPRPSPAAAAMSPDAAATPGATGPAEAPGSVPPAPGARAGTAAAPPPPGVPARIAGLDVLGVTEALERRRAGLLGGVTAIAGYLGVRELPACSGTFCARTGILAATPFTAATGFADIGPHLHPQLPAGVVLPAVAHLSDSNPDPAALAPQAPAAIVIARFDDARARDCLPAGRHCGEELVVERVAWVGGESYPPMLAVDPALADSRTAEALRAAGRAAERGLGTGSTPMLTVLVRPGTIPYIDPAMAPFIQDLGPDAVWYVRGLQLDPGADAIAWVLAGTDGSLLRSGALPIVQPAAGGWH